MHGLFNFLTNWLSARISIVPLSIEITTSVEVSMSLNSQLWEAVVNGKEDEVSDLLNNGADVNHRNTIEVSVTRIIGNTYN